MDKKVTDVDIDKIADFLPKWKAVLKLLGLEGQIIRDIEGRYRNAEDQRSEALNRWVRTAGPQATYRKIYTALCELDEHDAAEKVKTLAGGKVCVCVCVGGGGGGGSLGVYACVWVLSRVAESQARP